MLDLYDLQYKAKQLLADTSYFADVPIHVDDGYADVVMEQAFQDRGFALVIRNPESWTAQVLTQNHGFGSAVLLVQLAENPKVNRDSPETEINMHRAIMEAIGAMTAYDADEQDTYFRWVSTQLISDDPGLLGYQITFVAPLTA